MNEEECTPIPNTVLPDGKSARCESCVCSHLLEYFRGKNGNLSLRYYCKNEKKIVYIHPIVKDLDIPLVESSAYQKRINDMQQYQLPMCYNLEDLDK